MATHKPSIRFVAGGHAADPVPEGPTGGPISGRPVVAFEVRYYRCLDEHGRLNQSPPAIAQDPQRLRALYRAMTLTHQFDTKAIALQRTGQLGTYAPSLGQEAVGVAIGTAMRREDVLLPTYREYAAQILRGVAMHEILLYWGGDERGMDYQQAREDFPICVPIAAHAPHAVGVAFAFKYHKQARVAVCVLGDGATSKGDFYEALNLAGVWQLPVLFLISNNGWAISVPRHRQTASRTLAQKAIAAGIACEQVDGNDVIGLYDRIDTALRAIRTGEGPRVIEALTYRMGDHTTADDASRYRTDEEVEAQRQFDPLRRLRLLLQRSGHWDEAYEERLLADCDAEVEQAVRTYLDHAPQAPEAMFDHLYAQLPEALREQRDAAAGRKSSA